MNAAERDLYARRRAAVFEAMAGRGAAAAVFPAAPVATRNNDVEHEYRQDSDLHYLTGFTEPGAALLLDGAERKATLLVRDRDPERELWDGPRAGVSGAKEDFGLDDALPLEKLDEQLTKLLQNRAVLFYRLGRSRRFDGRVLDALDRVRARARTGVTWPAEIADPGAIVHEMRLFKGPEELACMREAARITGEAHVRAMSAASPGTYEHAVEAAILETFRRHGSERPAYGSIVGSGPNACVLHYRANNRKMEEGDLLLVDAGCEVGYYASDVTRTFPVSGRFSKPQQAIYEVVLEAQLAGIDASRVGVKVDDVHKACVEAITRGLVRLGLLEGEVPKLIESEAYKPFYMHRSSHWLGMDVHDVGAYFVAGASRPLAPGMVLTVEPGIYIAPSNDKVAPEWRGIGVRIEDDVRITEEGPDVLTAGIPKAVEEVERACA